MARDVAMTAAPEISAETSLGGKQPLPSKGVKILVDSDPSGVPLSARGVTSERGSVETIPSGRAATRTQGQGKKPTRRRAARFLVLLLGIVVFLPVWGLVRHSLFTTHYLPSHSKQQQASTSPHARSSRSALELQNEAMLGSHHGSSIVNSSHAGFHGDSKSDGSTNNSNSGTPGNDRSSGSVDSNSATRTRRGQKQGSHSSSQTRLQIVPSLLSSADLGTQAAKSLVQSDSQTSLGLYSQQERQAKQLGAQPEQQQEQVVSKTQGQEVRGQEEETKESQEQKMIAGGLRQDLPAWSRRMMVLPESEDYDAGESHVTTGGGHGAVAGASSAGVVTPRITRGVSVNGVLTNVGAVARDALAQQKQSPEGAGSERRSRAGKMERGLHTRARIQAQPKEERGAAESSDNNNRAGSSGSDASIIGPADVSHHRLVIGVTPTYQRAYQAVHITNIVNALRNVPGPFKWIVVEAPYRTEETQELLRRTAGLCWPEGHTDCRRIDYVHLETGLKEWARHNKGVVQRNCALQYVQDQRLDGVLYFMDDDNTYSPRLFAELRKVQRVGVLPVGFLNTEEYAFKNPEHQHRPMVERPLVWVGPRGMPEVYGWETYEWSIPSRRGGLQRTFCTDMAGFAFSSKLLWSSLPGVPGFPRHPLRFEPTQGGFLETTFLQKILPNVSLLEPLASQGTEVLVWHTHQEADAEFPFPRKWRLPQPVKERLVAADQDETVWPYIIGGRRHGIKGRSDKWPLPGYQLRDCGPWSLCSIRAKLQEHLW